MKSNRREFLRGCAVVDALKPPALSGAALIDEGEGSPPALSLPQYRAAGYLTKIGRRAMACEFEVLLNAEQYTIATEAALAALDLVDQLESQLSVFRDDSEVSRINRTAHLEPVNIEPRLFDLLELAAQIHYNTGGAYDITSGPLTKLWGFFRRQGRVPNTTELAHVMQHVGMRHVEFDRTRQTVRFLTPGVEINLGSIGKGYALDRMAELLAAERLEHFLLHGGNSSMLGRGTMNESTFTSQQLIDGQKQPEPPGWWIGLRHPLEPERRIGEVCLRNRALGTSGSGTQFFIHEGRRYGHILDPRTGRPVENTLSTTVAAPTAAEADALATAFYVMKTADAIAYCRQHAGIAAVIMSAAVADGVEIALAGWGEDEIQIYQDASLSIQNYTV
jgi:thiamine biosynthesis lipoprotein